MFSQVTEMEQNEFMLVTHRKQKSRKAGHRLDKKIKEWSLMQTIRERTNQNTRLVTQILYNKMPPQIKLKLATLNVKGLNNRGKQTNTFTILKSHKLDIIFLQKTNTTNKNMRNFLKNNGFITPYGQLRLPFSQAIKI